MSRNAKQANAVLRIKVVPKASQNRVSIAGDAIRIHVTVAPEKGQANEAVIRALGRVLGVPVSKLEIVSGAASRNKSVRFAGITQEELDRLIKEKIECTN